MIFAHLPTGYMLSRLWCRISPAVAGVSGIAVWGAIGGVIPDVDMFWSIMVDHGAVHHHRYATHWPLFWLCVLGAVALAIALRRARTGWHCLVVFALGVASHLTLDWVVSAMWLLAPLSAESFQLVSVPASYRPWILNFIFHWVGCLDISLALLGGAIYAKELRRRARLAPA
ncbi:MAG: metal-dependent hydrolase [Rhodocyclales bacterium]|nr:metal-dependent hydrolase [Rhodocyclales bacterium]